LAQALAQEAAAVIDSLISVASEGGQNG